MKKLVLFSIFSIPIFSQTSSLLDVSTGSRCVAVFVPTTAATDVQIDCQTAGKSVLSGAKINLTSIIGNTAGFVISYTVGADSVTLLFKRLSVTAPLHVEGVVNGVLVVTKDVTIP